MATKKKAANKKARPKKKMSDVEVARLAQEHREIKSKIKALEAKAEKRKKAIIQEMEARGLKAMETDEVRISVAQKSTVEYDLDALKERLGPRRLKLITREVVDKDKLARAVQDKKVDMKVVDRASSVNWNAPYIVVSPRGTD